jgi:putative cardiolipin synthase
VLQRAMTFRAIGNAVRCATNPAGASRRSRRARPVTAPVLCCIALLSGCATVNFEAPKEASYAVWPDSDTYLARRAADFGDDRPARSGFYDLGDGVDALAARYVLARRAERSLDVMYYVIKRDAAGSLVILGLLEAADRGVRVRVLVDDAERTRGNSSVATLNAHPNVEIRIFNPFARGIPVWLNALTDFRRITRRMHNKAFIADNRIAIVGGRNIADEYFAASTDVIFADTDIGCVGPLVGEVSAMFDAYWNHELAVPVASLADAPEDPEAALVAERARILETRKQLAEGAYGRALSNAVEDTVAISPEMVTWHPYELLYDSPDKGLKRRPDNVEPLIAPRLVEIARQAQDEMILLTPYFVPRKPAMELFRELRARDVRIRIITNSLASTNQPLVHSGYAPARRRLLGMGVELYEINPTSPDLARARDGVTAGAGTLHGKLFVYDRKQVFVGTFNLDPRSAYINTEMGVIIDDPGRAVAWSRRLDEILPDRTYRVTMNDKGDLRWTGEDNGEVVIFKREPETTLWQRTKANLLRLLPIKGQL